jgi:hypothetical protein
MPPGSMAGIWAVLSTNWETNASNTVEFDVATPVV